MSNILKIKQKLVTPTGIEYTVEEFLGSGGQGEVYKVTSGGKDWALKWYYPYQATDEQRKALDSLVLKSAPSDKFLWPLEVITSTNVTGFGYIMPIRPKNYKNIVDLMKRRIEPSFFTLATAGFQIADNFLYLHLNGMAYRDISFGNVFFNPQSGEVLICDNDNVTFDKTKTSLVKGTPRFMAPEIVKNVALPSSDTDRFSLAILLFYMFFISHPLEGKRESAIHALDQPAMEKLYGDEPLFIFDPYNSSNAPDPRYHQNAIIYWNIYPQFFKDLFIRTFTEGIKDPENGRVRESEWRSALIRLRDSIIYCSKCGCENFYAIEKFENSSNVPVCWHCRTKITLPPKIIIGNLSVMLNHNTRLYPYHLDSISYDFSKPIAELDRHPTNFNIWGLKNISEKVWKVTKSDETIIEVPPGKSIALGNGVRINFGSIEGEIGI